MQLSARNQLPATVAAIKEGIVTAEVVVRLDSGEELVSVITVDSVHRLQLAVGARVVAVIKSTEIMLATGD